MPTSVTTDKRYGRSMSAPEPALCRTDRTGSIMRVTTVEESLHLTYRPLRKAASDPGFGLAPSQVRFSSLYIREYSRSVGDNPSVSSGPPLSIGWEYGEEEEISVDEYESGRGPRRTSHQMVLPRELREEMLLKEWGASRNDIARAVRGVVKTKNQRRTTVHNLEGKVAKVEELLESGRRKARRFLFRQKRDSEAYKEWKTEFEQQWQISEAARAAAAIAAENAVAQAQDMEEARRSSNVVINEEDCCEGWKGGDQEITPIRSSDPQYTSSGKMSNMPILSCEDDVFNIKHEDNEEEGTDELKKEWEIATEQKSGSDTFEVYELRRGIPSIVQNIRPEALTA